MTTVSDPSGEPSEGAPRITSTKNYIAGLGLLFVVVLLWTASSFLTQDMYDDGYQKPFLITYTNTASFVFYLLPYITRRLWVDRWGPSKFARSTIVYQPLEQELDIDTEPAAELIAPIDQADRPLTVKETARMALGFCFLWFVANWALNAALAYTSVASATILSGTSGMFTLAVGRMFRVETLTLVKIGAVLTAFVGVILVAISDGSPDGDPDAIGPSIIYKAATSLPVLGDFLALMSAVFYAFYVVFLKVQIREESRIDMQLFFGFVGLFNIVLSWPIGVILHLVGIERFEVPTTHNAIVIILLNMFITLSSDYLYVVAMLKTTPLVVTIGLGLTIPVAVIGDSFLGKPAAVQVLVGALLVIGAFVAVGVENAKPSEGRDLLSGDFLDNARAQQSRVRLEHEDPLE
jgi:solute carrier family 35 protein F5